MKRRLSRRAFLGGAAVTVSLPFLEAMVPASLKTAAKAGTESPTRLVFIHVENGLIRTNFTPRTTGADYAVPRLLSPISDLKADFSVLSGLSNKVGGGSYTYPDGTSSNDGPGDHARDVGTFLTCARLRKTDGSDIRNGISVDQVAANHLRTETPDIPSLVLATRDGSYGGDSGYAPIYKSNISWVSETQPADKQSSPREVFNRLFAGLDPMETATERARRVATEQSLLDYVLEDANALSRELGARDREKLDEYLTGVRHLEVRLANSNLGAICDPGSPPADTGNHEEQIRRFWDVVRLAFQCDRTRVVTMMMYTSSFDFLGISGGHHSISHLDNGASDVDKIETINEWQIGMFGELLRGLKGSVEPDGTTLLDHSLVLFGGGLDGTGDRDGDGIPEASGPVHRHTNLPLLLAGRGNGAHRAGRHVRWNDDEPIADLYTSMLQAVGADVAAFGLDGTGPLDQLT
jgi:hypothetical protein